MHNTFQYELPYTHLLHVWQEIAHDIGPVHGEYFYVVQAEPEHAYHMKIRSEQAHTFNPTDWEEIYKLHAWLNILTPMNYSLYHGRNLLMMSNILPVAPQVGEISFLTDENMVQASISVKRKLMLLFKKALDELPFPRLQSKVDVKFEAGQKFVERLGFEKEGVLRKFGPSRDDYIMYGLLKE